VAATWSPTLIALVTCTHNFGDSVSPNVVGKILGVAFLDQNFLATPQLVF